jgi:hypothetical protein
MSSKIGGLPLLLTLRFNSNRGRVAGGLWFGGWCYNLALVGGWFTLGYHCLQPQPGSGRNARSQRQPQPAPTSTWVGSQRSQPGSGRNGHNLGQVGQVVQGRESSRRFTGALVDHSGACLHRANKPGSSPASKHKPRPLRAMLAPIQRFERRPLDAAQTSSAGNIRTVPPVAC